MKKLLLFIVVAFTTTNAQTPQPVGTGINATVYAFATDGTNLLIGNDSTNGGGYMVREWNGSSYATFALPIPPNTLPTAILGVAYLNGGRFATDGFNIHKLGDTLYAQRSNIYDFSSDGSNLYVSGSSGVSTFNYYRPTPGTLGTSYNAVSFDGTNWSSLSAFPANLSGTFMRGRSIGGNMYFAGNFTMYGGTLANIPIVKWDGLNFSVPFGNNNILSTSGALVTDIAMFNGNIYACSMIAPNGLVAKWNGTSWVTVSGAPANTKVMTVFDNKLWVIHGTTTFGLSYYDGTTWTSVPGFNGSVQTLQVVGNTLFIGGSFTAPQNHIAQIAAQPVSAFSASSNTICSNGCVTFTNTSANATTYTWIFPGGTPATSTSQNPGMVCFANQGSYTVSLVASNIAGSSTATTTITVDPLPTVTATASSTVCAGTSVTLSGSGTATSYTWSGGVTDGVGFIPSSTASYTVTGTGANGCTNTATSSVVVNPLAAANAGTDATIMNGNSTTLNGNGNGTYNWSPATGLSCTTCASPTANPTVTITYTLSITNSCGTAIDSVTVTVVPNTTGIFEQTKGSGIFLYPNPNNGTFTIVTEEKECELIITNVLGEKILVQKIQNDKSEIDLSNELNGIYFFQVKTEQGTANKKIIIQK